MHATLDLLPPHSPPSCDLRLSANETRPTPRHVTSSLMDRLRRREADACDEFVRNYLPRMTAVARRILHCHHAADDAVQDALLAAFNSLDSFQGQSQLWTWLYRIVVNSCLMQRRARRRRPTLSLAALPREAEGFECDALPRAGGLIAPLDLLAREEARANVRECIQQLPDGYRTILQLRDIEEFSTDETAGILGISRAAVKTRLHRARTALRGLLNVADDADGR